MLVQIMACHRTGEKPLENQWWFLLLIHLHFMRHAASMINTLLIWISVFVIFENNLLRPMVWFHISDRPSSKSIKPNISDYLWRRNCKAFDIGRIAIVYSIVYLSRMYWHQSFADRLRHVMVLPTLNKLILQQIVCILYLFVYFSGWFSGTFNEESLQNQPPSYVAMEIMGHHRYCVTSLDVITSIFAYGSAYFIHGTVPSILANNSTARTEKLPCYWLNRQQKQVGGAAASLTDPSKIPQCRTIFHNAPLCNRNVHTCAHFCYKVVHCGIFAWRIMEFVRWIYSNESLWPTTSPPLFMMTSCITGPLWGESTGYWWITLTTD